MILGKINRNYAIIGVVLYLLLTFMYKPFNLLHLLTVMVFIFYAVILWYAGNRNTSYYNKKNLYTIVAVSLFVEMAAYLLVSWNIRNNLFVFSEADAMFYFKSGLVLREYPISVTFRNLALLHPFEDWGGIFLIALITRIIPSKLFLNFIYLLLGVAVAGKMYNIGTKIMNPKYAFLAALTFSISSFTAFFYSSALKEPFMIFLSVAAFDSFYNYMKTKQQKQLAYAVIWTSLFIFFRPAVMFFLFAAGGMTLLMGSNMSRNKRYGLLLVICVAAVALSSLMGDVATQYMGSNSSEYAQKLDYAAQDTGYGTNVSLIVSFLATVAGPFPALIPKSNGYLSLFGPGLLYRVMLTFPFLIGVVLGFKEKISGVLPLIFFTVLEMLSLSIILEGLELRLQMPHMPMVYVLAFWAMYIIDSGQWRPKGWVATILNFWPLAVAMMAFIWNVR